MPSVEMINRNPVELGVEILLHLGHEVADEGLEVRELSPLIGRHNKAELMRVLLGPLEKRLTVDIVGGGAVEPTGLSFARDTVAHDVLEMGPRGAEVAGYDTRVAGLDDDAPTAWPDETGGGAHAGAHATLE